MVQSILPNCADIVKNLVCELRISLGDAWPDADYKFMPPELPGQVFKYNKFAKYRWRDEELILCIGLAQSRINATTPPTSIGITEMYRSHLWLLIQAARVEALKIMVSKWIADEFSYSIAGKSLDLEKASKYQSFLDSMDSQVDEAITNQKDKYKYVTKGIRRGGVYRQFPFRITIGYIGTSIR